MPISPIDELRLKLAYFRAARKEYGRACCRRRTKERAVIRLIEQQPLQRIVIDTNFKVDALQRMGLPRFVRVVNGILDGEYTQCGNGGLL